MSAKKQSIWNRPWVVRCGVTIGFLLLTLVFFGVVFRSALAADPTLRLSEVFITALILAVFASLASISVIFLIRWLRCWRNVRRFLFGAACFATLMAIFYAEENWRGKRAWEKCKYELEAKAEVLDWAAYIPAPIPDEQNIFKAPKMTEWFVKPSSGTAYTNELSAKLSYQSLNDAAKRDNPKSPILVAQVTVVPLNAHVSSDGEVVRPDAPDAEERLGRIVHDAVGPSADGSQGLTFVQRLPGQIKPVRLWLETDRQFAFAEVAQLFPTNLVSRNVGDLRVEAGPVAGSYRIVLATKPVISAEDYLAMSDAGAPEFNLIREALKRPKIRMDDDLQRPFQMPIVGFVNIRNLAQIAASRAQCCLLLGRSDQAFRELSFVCELRRLLAAKPAGLVAAMIDVAVTGLYVGTIADGFRLQAWREPELVALQNQLQQINLPPQVTDAFRSGRAQTCQMFQVVPAGEMASFYYDSANLSWREKITNPKFLLYKLAPRGWIYQNLTTLAPLEQTAIEIFDPTTQLIDPAKAESAVREVEKALGHWNPYTILERRAVPNCAKAMQTTARNQTLVNQALVVCGLERYHRAKGEYPETLDALVPQFVERLPHDIIGGQPLNYRRTADGKFVLYSVGWNETDDGGQPSLTKNGPPDFLTGDWVWQLPAK